MSVDEDKEVIGHLKVSLEAAKALTGIYQEFHQKSETKKEDETSEEEEEDKEEELEEEKKKDPIQMIDYDDGDSDFYWKQFVWDEQRDCILPHHFTILQSNKIKNLFWKAFVALKYIFG